VKTTTLTLSDNCPRCGTKTLELDNEGDIHCWGCGTTHGKPEKRDYLLERHQFFEKNKTAILADVKRIGASATAKKWEVNAVSLYHVLQRWKRESKQTETEKPRKERKKRKTRRGSNYTHLPGVRKHQYFESNKDNIIADLLTLGRAAVISKWDIGKSALRNFETRHLTDEQRDKITKLGVQLRTVEVKTSDDRFPVFPEFSPDWDPTVQVKWLEIYEKLYKERMEGAKNV
jgi:hypothetical protein